MFELSIVGRMHQIVQHMLQFQQSSFTAFRFYSAFFFCQLLQIFANIKKENLLNCRDIDAVNLLACKQADFLQQLYSRSFFFFMFIEGFWGLYKRSVTLFVLSLNLQLFLSKFL